MHFQLLESLLEVSFKVSCVKFLENERLKFFWHLHKWNFCAQIFLQFKLSIDFHLAR